MKVCTVCGAKWRGEPSVCPLDGGPLEDLPDPLIGRTIGGRYVIAERIGSGGMGVVYRASHELVGGQVAIKFLAPELAADPTNRERFLREARAANRIDHAHIIDITDFGESDDGLVYLVMEYLDGESLADVIYRSPLPARRALDIAMQVAAALARAHELDVIHRDIKPENVFLLKRKDGGDFVKLLDFGLAKMKGEIRLTATGAVFGTPEYMAPEQARGAPVTGQADLYAMGCLIHEMLTGDPPFQGAAPELILKHIRAEPTPPSAQMPDIPPELDALVLQLLEKEPTARHRGAHHLYEELKRVNDLLPRPSTYPTLREQGFGDAIAASLEQAPIPDTISSASETWDKKLRRFRELAREAHGASVPAWLDAGLTELEGWVAELGERRADLSRRTSEVMGHEDDIRGARLRVGQAIDVLGRDESRALRALAQIDERQRGMLEDQEATEVTLRKAWSKLAPLEPGGDIPVAQAAHLSLAGRAASEWLERADDLATLYRERQRLENERDDLRFQIAQLKGRIGSMSAEGDLDLDSMRERVREVDHEVQDLLDRMALRSEEVVKHFLEFPELTDRVREAQR